MIVVGVDGSDAARDALQLGLHEASIRGTHVRAVHAWMPAPMVTVTGPGMIVPTDVTPYAIAAEELLRHVVEAVAGDAFEQVERVVVASPAGAGVLDNAHDAEMIVVGRRGLNAIESILLGSVSGHVVKHATCPVLVVPARHNV